MFVRSLIGVVLATACVGLLAMTGDGDPFSALSKTAAYIMVGAAALSYADPKSAGADRAAARSPTWPKRPQSTRG